MMSNEEIEKISELLVLSLKANDIIDISGNDNDEIENIAYGVIFHTLHENLNKNNE